MSFIDRIGLWFVQIAVFLGVFVGLLIADRHFNIDRYAPGAEPHRSFPVVAVRAQDQGSKPVEYRLVTWHNLEGARRKDPSLSFKLPETVGHFELSPGSGSFTVTRTASDEQLVEVVSSTSGDLVFRGKYLTDGNSVRPVSLHVGGMTGAALLEAVAALVAAWLVGRLLRRQWSGNVDGGPQ